MNSKAVLKDITNVATCRNILNSTSTGCRVQVLQDSSEKHHASMLEIWLLSLPFETTMYSAVMYYHCVSTPHLS